jgi:hypothetical protein
VPTVTPTPSPTPTATLDPRDQYEPDDTSPAPLAVGEVQTHNFYPDGDVDYTSVWVKADRQFLVSTSNLMPGVDTLMQVDLDGQVWVNDDYLPPATGDYSSAVCFPVLSDSTATVTVSNVASQYGSDKTYDLTVSEVAGLDFSPPVLDFGTLTAGDPNPPAQALDINGSGGTVTWDATADANWIGIDISNGVTPSTMNVSVDATGLAPGSYEGTITFTWDSLCQKTVTVLLEVVASTADGSLNDAPTFFGRRVIRPGVIHKQDLDLSSSLHELKPVVIQQGADGAVTFVIMIELKTDLP